MIAEKNVTPAGQETAMVPHAFARAVREALRSLHETRGLIRNPLLDSSLVAERAGDAAAPGPRLEALQDIVRSTVRALEGNARTEPMGRALLHTYLEPAETQLRAAERARMSFGTYRRQLSAGIEEVATRLWLARDNVRVSIPSWRERRQQPDLRGRPAAPTSKRRDGKWH
jgi:hypothetical protein